jgi:hypothetical protein
MSSDSSFKRKKLSINGTYIYIYIYIIFKTTLIEHYRYAYLSSVVRPQRGKHVQWTFINSVHKEDVRPSKFVFIKGINPYIILHSCKNIWSILLEPFLLLKSTNLCSSSCTVSHISHCLSYCTGWQFWRLVSRFNENFIFAQNFLLIVRCPRSLRYNIQRNILKHIITPEHVSFSLFSSQNKLL